MTSGAPRNISIYNDHNVDVADAVYPDLTQINVFGHTDSVSTSYQDIWNDNSVFSHPTGVESWEVVSDNAADTFGGTGMNGVRVTGLDATGVKVFEDIALNGTTPVALTGAWTYPRIVIGGLSGSGQTNAGDITVRVASAGATRMLISPTDGRSMSSIYQVPKDTTAFIQNVCFIGTSNKDLTIRVRVMLAGTNTWATITTIPFDGTPVVIPVIPDFALLEGTRIRTEVKSSSNASVELSSIIQIREKIAL